MSPTLPATMTAIEIARPGGPDVLVPATRPVPAPAVGEVLLKVAAAGVNRPDVLQRQGGYAPPKGASDIPGLEVAGEVVALGPGVADLALGDRVCALVAGGGYAEYCVVPVPQALPMPRGMDAIAAAGLPETFFTVWTNVFQRGRLAPGERFLVHGGASGIGTTAIQIAAARGARVFATAGTDAKCRTCESLGAERGINYKTEDFADVVLAATGGGGVDVILDMVGGSYLARNLRAIALEGRIVLIAFLGGSKTDVDLTPIMMKRATLTGSTLRPRTVEQKGAIAAELRREVWPLLDSGRIKPVIHATFPLAAAAAAHHLLDADTHTGKIILTV